MTQLFVAQAASPQSGLIGFLPIVAIVMIFYFLMYRPMRKRQKKLEEMVSSLKPGDKVITTGGIYGSVSRVQDGTIVLKVADQTKIEVAKSAITALQAPEGPSG